MKKCEWKEIRYFLTYEGYDFKTSCNNEHYFYEGRIEDNDFEYCLYCGGKIKEIK